MHVDYEFMYVDYGVMHLREGKMHRWLGSINSVIGVSNKPRYNLGSWEETQKETENKNLEIKSLHSDTAIGN